MACPPCVPANQASRIAGTCSAIQPMVSGRPLISTTTVGVPVAWTASDQVQLAARQVERGARGGLAAHRSPTRRRRRSPRPTACASRTASAMPSASIALDLAALGIIDPRSTAGSLGDLGPDAGQEGDDVLRLAVAAPVAERGLPVVGERARRRRSTERPAERQHAALVLQEHQRTPGDLARGGQVLGGSQEDVALAALVDVGMVEQTQAALEPEDAPDGLVDPVPAGPCRPDQLRPMRRRRVRLSSSMSTPARSASRAASLSSAAIPWATSCFTAL